MTGEMEKPLVIGSSARPRRFKNINTNELLVLWKSNKKAWMTAALMEDWLKGFNERMKQQKRRILWFLDNATCHPHLELSNVQLAWFPSNTTIVTQPMDQEVINCVKLNYRKLVMQSLIANTESSSSASQLARSISVLDAGMWIAEAVKQVSPETVKSCFQKAKFMLGGNEDVEIKSNNTENLQELTSATLWRNLCQQ
jgi:hypothetical protein